MKPPAMFHTYISLATPLRHARGVSMWWGHTTPTLNLIVQDPINLGLLLREVKEKGKSIVAVS